LKYTKRVLEQRLKHIALLQRENETSLAGALHEAENQRYMLSFLVEEEAELRQVLADLEVGK
jgi:hypothetical protein